MAQSTGTTKRGIARNSRRKMSFRETMHKYGAFYLLAAPALLYLLVFRILPLFGLGMAFQSYVPWLGMKGSPWVGLSNFNILFRSADFYQKVANTLIINFYKLLVVFPAPIILAILFNELRFLRFKKIVQTISYFPNFISWVVVAGILFNFLSYDMGFVNKLLVHMGMEKISWYQSPEYWRGILVGSAVWKNIGYGSIIYLASIASIPQELYEAADIDGAGRFQKIRYITIPGVIPIATVMFLLTIGGMMAGDFEQIQAFMGNNGALYASIDVLETFMYRIITGQPALISFGVAAGLVQSVLGFIMLLTANRITGKYNSYTFW